MYQWDRSPSTCSDQAEGGDADAVFILESGATLSNVIIGPNNGEGVHCKGPCTLNNVLVASPFLHCGQTKLTISSCKAGGPTSAKTPQPSSNLQAPPTSTAAAPATPTTRSSSTTAAAP
jgi:hypothetical protein